MISLAANLDPSYSDGEPGNINDPPTVENNSQPDGTPKDLNAGRRRPTRSAGVDPSPTVENEEKKEPHPVQSSEDREVHHAVGSANIETSLDKDTARAETTLSGQGSNSSTKSESQEDDVTVASNGPTDSHADVERTQQYVENETDGAAYGDPETVEDIGSGDAVTDTTPENQPEQGGDWLGESFMLYATVALVGLAMVRGGD
ncbi:hypothetical protein [Haloarchaeobius sp. DT45]|uniref:hypothetical protein n=1 Tax=Haloarchaeobius sp. DT45 TaxID=3446116 RepID=UPI003F6B889E